MQTSLVLSDGQIVIPKEIRQQLGIKNGSKLNAVVVAMLKSNKTAVPSDFDVSELLNNDRNWYKCIICFH